MNRRLAAAALAILTLAMPATVQAAPGNGTNAVLVFNDCGGTAITLVSQASPRAAFATAHVVGSNRPAPLTSLSYVVTAVIDGETVVLDSGGYAHPHVQQGQPVVSCSGYFTTTDPESGLLLTITIQVTGFFPAGV